MANKFRNSGKLKVTFFSFQDILTSVTGILILVTLMMTFYLDLSSNATQTEPRSPSTPSRQAIQSVRQSNIVLQAQLTRAKTAASDEQLRQQLEDLQKHEKIIRGQLGDLPVNQAQLREALSTNQVLEGICNNLRSEVRSNETALEKDKMRTNAVFVIKGAQRTTKRPIIVVIARDFLFVQPIQANGTASRGQIISGDALPQFRSFAGQHSAATEYFVFMVKPSGVPLFTKYLDLATKLGYQVGYEPIFEHIGFDTAEGTTP